MTQSARRRGCSPRPVLLDAAPTNTAVRCPLLNIHPRTFDPAEASSQQNIDGPHEITAREAPDLLGYSDTHLRRIRAHLGLIRTNPYCSIDTP